MHALDRFIPADRRSAIAAGVALPDRAHGTTLFADLSDFTALTIALQRSLGQRAGAEEVAKLLETIFGDFTDEVRRCGGSVVTFSGDAITCWFDGDEGARAVTCAYGCHALIKRHAEHDGPTGEPLALGLKVTIVNGSVRRFVVGDPEIQRLDVIGGDTLERLARGAGLTCQGETLVDEAVLAAVQGDVDLLTRADNGASEAGFALVSGSPARVGASLFGMGQPDASDDVTVSDERVREWVLPLVYDRITAGHGAYLAELRLAVPMFIKFSGVDLEGDDEAGAKLDAFVTWVQRELMRYGGHVLDLALDKGTYLCAVFGVPAAHNDDCVRAASVARALLEAPERFAFIQQIHIGISHGRVSCGVQGAGKRSAYVVRGGVVNLAARLMAQASAGQIVVDKQVAAALKSRFSLRPLGVVSLKGVDESVEIHEVGEPVGGDPSLPEPRSAVRFSALSEREERPNEPMIGRNEERALFSTALCDLLDGGNGTAFIVEGDAGIGKSHCINALLRDADRLGVSSLQAVAHAVERTTLYHAYRPLFVRLFGLDHVAPTTEARRAHVLDLLADDDEAVRLAPLLNAVLPLVLPDNDHTRDMAEQVRADNTNKLLCRLIRRLVNKGHGARGAALDEPRPMILVIEDAHWLDSASWRLTLEIRIQIERLLVLVATRPVPEPWPVAYQALREESGVTLFMLQPLSPDDTDALICMRLGVRELPKAVAELIRDKAEGHPFFSEEITYALRDAGHIEVADGVCRVSSEVGAMALAVPDSVEGVITSRFDILTASQQLALKVASVIGRVFAFRVLRDIYPVDAEWEQIPRDLEQLCRLDITPVESATPNLSYIFKHVITQEVAYNLMLTDQRKMLHGAVARWYERTYEQDLSPHYPVLAQHCADGELWFKALDYTEKAAEQALRSFANREVIDLIGRAQRHGSELLRGDDAVPAVRRALWERQLADAHLGLGQLEEAREHYRRALALQGHPMPRTSLGVALSLIWHALLQLLYRLLPDAMTRAADSRRADYLEWGNTWERIAQVVYFYSDRLGAIYASVRASNCAQRAGPSPEMSRAHANLCICLGMAHMQHLSNMYGRLAHGVARELDNQPSIGWAHLLSGAAQLGFGNLEAAREEASQAIETYHRIGDWRHWEESTALQHSITASAGDLARAAEMAVAVYTSARRRRDPQTLLMGLCAQAEVRMLVGGEDNDAEALDHTSRARLLLEDNTAPGERIRVLSNLALAQVRNGDHAAARETLTTWLDHCRTFVSAGSYMIEAYGSAAEAAGELFRLPPDEAPADAEVLGALARSANRCLGSYAFVFRVARARADVWRGVQAAGTGRSAKARRLFAQAIATAGALGQPYEGMLAHRELSACLPEGDPDKKTHREHADRMHDELRRALAKR